MQYTTCKKNGEYRRRGHIGKQQRDFHHRKSLQLGN